jgi:hypothetical protein
VQYKMANPLRVVSRPIQRHYMRLSSALERVWTNREDKRHAAILLRNAAIETPHCHFCGCGQNVDLYESRYNPKARICKLCAAEIAAKFHVRRTQPSQEPSVSEVCTTPMTLVIRA